LKSLEKRESVDRPKILTASLFISGFVLIIAGSYTAMDPQGFYLENGARLGDGIGLLNCVRGTGAMLFTFGALTMSGVVFRKMVFTSSLLSVLVVLSYAVGRAASAMADGWPSEELVRGNALEFIVGILALYVLWAHGSKAAFQRMDRTWSLKAVLLLSGTMMIGFGVASLVAPQFLYGVQHVELGYDVNVVNFARAQGSTFLVCGFAIIAGIFVERMTFSSTVIASVVFAAYGSGRIISVAADGMPPPKLLGSIAVELFVGTLALLHFVRQWRRSPDAAAAMRGEAQTKRA
jgi:hypothetical protein